MSNQPPDDKKNEQKIDSSVRAAQERFSPKSAADTVNEKIKSPEIRAQIEAVKQQAYEPSAQTATNMTKKSDANPPVRGRTP